MCNHGADNSLHSTQYQTLIEGSAVHLSGCNRLGVFWLLFVPMAKSNVKENYVYLIRMQRVLLRFTLLHSLFNQGIVNMVYSKSFYEKKHLQKTSTKYPLTNNLWRSFVVVLVLGYIIAMNRMVAVVAIIFTHERGAVSDGPTRFNTYS